MNNCFLPECFPVSLNETAEYSKLFIENFNTPYTCPEGWEELKMGWGNECSTKCPEVVNKIFSRGNQIWFPFGPGEGYPLSRQSAVDFCNDRANNSSPIPYTVSYDDLKFWQSYRINKVPVWPPPDSKQAADVAEADRLNAIKAKERREEAERVASQPPVYPPSPPVYTPSPPVIYNDGRDNPSYKVISEAAHKLAKQNSASSSSTSPLSGASIPLTLSESSLLPIVSSLIVSPTVVSEESVVKKDTEWFSGIENRYVIIGIIGLLFILLIRRK